MVADTFVHSNIAVVVEWLECQRRIVIVVERCPWDRNLLNVLVAGLLDHSRLTACVVE